MAMYELDGNHLLPVRLGRSADAITLSHSLVAIQRQIVDVLRRPLFPLAWDQVNGGQSLTALDATGQVVVVEVLESVDSTGLLAAMSRLTVAAAAGRREIASRYAGGLGAFSRDWNEFREAMPAQVEAGPRLTILSASLEPDVVGGLGVLASSGLEIHEVDVRIVDESRIVVVVEKISGTDMAAGGPLLVARAPRPALAGSSGPGGPTGSRAMNALEQAEQVSPVTGPIEIVLTQEPAGEPDTDAGDSAVPIGAFAATGAADALSEMFEPVAVTAEQPQVRAAAADRDADRAEETAGDAAAVLDDGASDSSTDSSPDDSRTDSRAGSRASSRASSTAGSSGDPAADDPGMNGHDAVDGRPEHTRESSQGSSGDSPADVVSQSAGNADAVEADASDASDVVNAVDGPGGADRSSGDPGDRDGGDDEDGKDDKIDKADDEQSGAEVTADGSGGQDLTDVLNRNSVAGPIPVDPGDEPGADDVDHDGPGSSDGASDSTDRSSGEPGRSGHVHHVHHVHHAHHADPSDDTSAEARTVAASAGSAHSDAQLGAAASDDAADTAASHASTGDSEATDAPNDGDSRSRMGRHSREVQSQFRENAPAVSPTSHAAAPVSGASDVTETGEREARSQFRENAPAVSPTSHAAAPASGTSDVTETGEHSVQAAEAWSTVAPNEGRPEEPTTAAVPLVSWEPLRGSADALDPVAEALGGDPSKSLLVQETAELAAVAATLGGPTQLIWQRLRRGIYHEATLSVEGVITLSDGRSFTDPTSAANAAQDVNDADGWRVWRVGVRGAHLGDLRDSLADRSS